MLRGDLCVTIAEIHMLNLDVCVSSCFIAALSFVSELKKIFVSLFFINLIIWIIGFH